MSGSPVGKDEWRVRDAAGLRRALLAWYRRHHRRLPWREDRNPYRVWVSEVMLQQTQVATAIPYYERFLTRFPDVRALARAPRARVLAAWAGLGYYRRARHLHEAAAIVVREHGGRIPSEPEAFARLPGVGRYTVGAVLSIGFGRPLPVLDGNVARVFSRLTAAPLAVRRPADAKRLWALADLLMPSPGRGSQGQERPGLWNQALMELGALVCTPRAPRCEACPVRAHCEAHARGLQHELPPVPARRRVETVRRAVACVWREGRLLVERLSGRRLEGLHEPPGVELAHGASASRALHRRLAALGLPVRLTDTGRRIRHTVTHHDIRVEVWQAVVPGPTRGLGRSLRWCDPRRGGPALSALGARLLREGPGRGRGREEE